MSWNLFVSQNHTGRLTASRRAAVREDVAAVLTEVIFQVMTSVIKFPEAHPACRGHLLDIVTLLWHTRDSLFPEAGSIGLGDLCSKLACGSLLSRSCAL